MLASHHVTTCAFGPCKMALGMLNKSNQVKRRVQVSRGAGAGRHDSALRWLPLAVNRRGAQVLDRWKYDLFVAFEADGYE
jgi:hypothetical protein